LKDGKKVTLEDLAKSGYRPDMKFKKLNLPSMFLVTD
jgi:hypothetical protein